MSETIHGYYVDVPGLDRVDELKLVCLWRERWAAAGWEPIVLNEFIARKHPYFEEYDLAISALPSVNPKNYDRACWLRHLALAQAGGGYMSDFDVIPFIEDGQNALPLLHPEQEGILQMYQSCAPSLFYASEEAAENICCEFAKGTWGNTHNEGGRSHMSDMHSLVVMPPELVQPHDIVKGYRDEGWETAPFVHYSTGSMRPDGKIPRWKWIPKLRQ